MEAKKPKKIAEKVHQKFYWIQNFHLFQIKYKQKIDNR